MSLSALSSFAEGFVGAKLDKRDREERERQGLRDDALIAALGARPMGGGMGASGGMAGGMQDPMRQAGENPTWQGSGYGKPDAGAMGAGGGDGLLSLIDKHEGGGRYDTLFGHSQNSGQFAGVDVSKMTLADVYQFSDPSGEYGQWVKGKVGRVATPMGRYQIVGTTLRSAAKEMGLPPETVFDQNTQDSIAGHLAKRRLAGAGSPAAKRAAMRSEWEGFKHVSDSVLDDAIAKYESTGGVLQPRPLGAIKPTTGGPQ